MQLQPSIAVAWGVIPERHLSFFAKTGVSS